MANPLEANKPIPNSWNYLKKPGFQPRPLRVAVLGAGLSGICVGAKIFDAQKNGTLAEVELNIYDRNTDYGGVWHSNRYPGCQVDFPSHAFQYGFAPNSDWSHVFSPSAEVNTYLHHVAKRYGLEPLIRLRHTMKSAVFNEKSGTWDLTIQNDKGDIFHSEVDVYIVASGILIDPNRPYIEGIEHFVKSPILHTAEWPKDLDWKTAFREEKVAVIGTGSSGLQTIGAISPYTKSVDVYAKSHIWIAPPLTDGETAGNREWKSGNAAYTEEEKERFRTDPHALLKHGAEMNRAINHIYDVALKGSDAQRRIQAQLRAFMEKSLEDKVLIKQLVPDWEVWCRRVTPAAAFLDAVRKPHVRVITDRIERITANSIITTSGEEHEVDRIILATGFNTSFKPRYEFRGRDGLQLTDLWGQQAEAYMSLAVSGFPNCFFALSGPGSAYGNGSSVPCLELNVDYIVSALAKLQKEDLKYMDVDQEAQDEYNQQQRSLMKDLVFTGNCNSWYKQGSVDGTPDILYAGSALQFMETIRYPRWEDWNFKRFHGNRFSYLGDGRGTHETIGGDRAYYLKYEPHTNPIRTAS